MDHYMYKNYSIVLTTIRLEIEAEVLAEKLLRAKLAACVQIQKIKSFYTWNGKTECIDEYLLSIKTKTALFQIISDFIKLNHCYEMPEIVQIPITSGSKEYLCWLKESLE